MQDPLGRAFPFGGVGAHLDQLAGKGQVVGVDPQVGAEPCAQLQAGAREVVDRVLQAAQLVVDRSWPRRL